MSEELQQTGEEKKKLGSSTEALLKRLWPIFAISGFLIIVAAVLVPLAIVFKNNAFLYVTIALIAAGLTGLIVILVVAVKKYGFAADRSLYEMERQLNDFSEGDIKMLSIRHYSPVLDKFQDSLNKTISSYSSLRFVYKTSEADREIDEKIASGVVLSFPEFMDRLPHEIQRNLNFRSALIFIQSLGGGAGDPSTLRDLHEAIMNAFPSSLIGLYDDTTFALYDREVSSFRALREQLERLVASYKSLKANKGTNITNLAYCKCGASVYPYVPLTSLVDDGLLELKKSDGVSLTSDISKVYYPHAILTEDNKRIIYFATVENYEALYGKAASYSEAVQALRKYGAWLASQIGFTAAGFLSYYQEADQYDLVFEAHKDASTASFSKLGERIKAEAIDPFYEEAVKDVFFATSDVNELPPALSAPLGNLGIASFYFAAIRAAGVKRGFIYFTGFEKREALSMVERELLSRYASLASSFVTSLQEKSKADENSAVVEALSDRAGKFIYSLDRATHKLTYLSKNLQRSFPNAKVGDLCYKALRDEQAPCARCPLSHGVDHRIIERLSSTECAISVLLYKGAWKGQSTILIEDTGRENVKSSNRFLDQNLLIRNREALALDLTRQLKLHESGYVVALRIVNPGELIKKAPGSDNAAIMSMVTKSIRDAGYGDIVYRLNEFDLVFLLKSYLKNKITGFVEEISSIVKGPMDYQYVKLEPKYAYCSVGYPGEAQTAREIMSLTEGELNRSATFGEGYLTQVADNHPRKASRDDYVDDLLQKTLSRDIMPIAIQPIYQAVTNKIASLDVLARLYGNEGDQIPSGELFAAAGRRNMVDKVDIGALFSAGKLAEDYGETYFNKVGIASESVRLSNVALRDPGFVDNVKKFFEKYSLPKSYLHFIVENSLLSDYKQDMKTIMDALKDYGIIWEVNGVNEDNCSLDELKAMGFMDLRTEMSFISRAVNNPNDYQICSRFVYSANRDGFNLVCCGIETEEEKQVAEHMEFPMLSGYYLSKPLQERDLIQVLAFTK
jgi:EAL domain-containing protein (putative c-di-GMP-specific phosphodiesterase class I)